MSVIKRTVEFPSGGITLRGVLRLPSGDGPKPVVIIAHGMGGLKEWANIPSVSDALIEAGIATLAFDYRNFGDSDGLPREDVDHIGEIEDYRSAISFASTLKEINQDTIGIWGTSLGGRNVLVVGAQDRRVKCVVAQVPGVLITPIMLAYIAGHNGDVEAFNRALAQDKHDRANGEEPRYIAMGDDDPNAEYAEHTAAFGEEEKRNWKRRVTLQTYDPAGFIDVSDMMSQISPAALRMVLVDHDIAAPISYAVKLYELAQEPKSMVVLPGHHYTPYTTWRAASAQAARDWFVEHLKPGPFSAAEA